MLVMVELSLRDYEEGTGDCRVYIYASANVITEFKLIPQSPSRAHPSLVLSGSSLCGENRLNPDPESNSLAAFDHPR